MEFELNREFRDRFQEALNERDDNFIRQSLEEVNPADITALLYEFSGEESKYVLDLLSLETRAKIVNDLDSDTRKAFLANHTTEEIIQVLNLLDSVICS